MLPEKPVQSNTSDPEWLAYELVLVRRWANLPGRNGLKTDSTISQYEQTLKGLLDSAGKPFCQMTVADIAEYVDVINSANRLAKITKFLQWAHQWGHITVDLAYVYEHRNPHIVKMDKVWDEPTQALYDRWIASLTFRTPDGEHDYRPAIMRVWSYFSGPLDTLTTDDVKGMNVNPRDRGIGERFSKWLATQPVEVATPDVPVPDSSETIARMQAELDGLKNTVEILTVNNNILVSYGGSERLAARIRALEIQDSKPDSTDAHRSLAKRITNMEDLWNRQLEARLADQDRLHATTVEGLSQCMRLIHNLVVTCYTGTNPIHPVDAKDRLHLVQTMIRFRNRTSELLGTTDDADHSPSALMAGSRNGVAHAPGDDDKWPG